MSISMRGLQASTQARGLPGKGSARAGFSGTLASIKRLACVCAKAWTFAHRTRRVMGIIDEAATARKPIDDRLDGDVRSLGKPSRTGDGHRR